MDELRKWQEQADSILVHVPDPDPAYQWDPKCKQFSLAEIYTPPSAILLIITALVGVGTPV